MQLCERARMWSFAAWVLPSWRVRGGSEALLIAVGSESLGKSNHSSSFCRSTELSLETGERGGQRKKVKSKRNSEWGERKKWQEEEESIGDRKKEMDNGVISGNARFDITETQHSREFCLLQRDRRGAYTAQTSLHIPALLLLKHEWMYIYLSKFESSGGWVGHTVQQYWRGISLLLVRCTVCTLAMEM